MLEQYSTIRVTDETIITDLTSCHTTKYHLKDDGLAVTNRLNQFWPHYHLFSGDWVPRRLKGQQGHYNLFQNCAVFLSCDPASVLNDDRRSDQHIGPSTNSIAISQLTYLQFSLSILVL